MNIRAEVAKLEGETATTIPKKHIPFSRKR